MSIFVFEFVVECTSDCLTCALVSCSGNQAKARQNIRVSDVTAPLLNGTAINGTFECDNVPAATTFTASDDCTENVQVTFNETRHNSAVCPFQYVLERTYMAYDDWYVDWY